MFNEMKNEINADVIMKEIRQNIENRGYAKDPISFEEVEMKRSALEINGKFDWDEFIYELEFLNDNCTNSFHLPVTAKKSFFSIIKKVICKMIKFIVVPVLDFQNAYNVSNLRCMCQINEYISDMEKYKARIEQLEEELRIIKEKHL